MDFFERWQEEQERMLAVVQGVVQRKETFRRQANTSILGQGDSLRGPIQMYQRQRSLLAEWCRKI